MIDITKGTHKVFFPSKLFAVENGHIFNITLAANHDNGEIVVRDTSSWNSFDNYDENEDGVITMTGVIRGQGANGGYYVEVLTAEAAQDSTSGTATYANDLVLVYNSPVSEYSERELQDEALFYNAAGEVAQGFTLQRGDIFEISSDAFTGTIADDALVEYDAATKKYVIQ